MRNIIRIAWAFSLLAAGCQAATTKPVSTVVGTLKIQKIESHALKQSRTIRVWLPAGYDADPSVRYPALYMQDGQNCFDRATSAFGMEWEIDETLTKLIAEKQIPPLIVVGIDNGGASRLDELTFEPDPAHGGGHAAAYADFVLNEVKPLVEKSYRVQSDRAHTFVGGSSLGGLFSLELARRHPDTFAGVIAMSPSIWWDGQSLITDIEQDAGGLAGTRVWLDMGAHEISGGENQEYLDAGRRLDAALSHHHVEHHFMIDAQHVQHNEHSWAARFPQAITYLLAVP